MKFTDDLIALSVDNIALSFENIDLIFFTVRKLLTPELLSFIKFGETSSSKSNILILNNCSVNLLGNDTSERPQELAFILFKSAPFKLNIDNFNLKVSSRQLFDKLILQESEKGLSPTESRSITINKATFSAEGMGILLPSDFHHLDFNCSFCLFKENFASFPFQVVKSNVSLLRCEFEYSYSKTSGSFIRLNFSSLNLVESNIIGVENVNEYLQLPKPGNFFITFNSQISIKSLIMSRVFMGEVGEFFIFQAKYFC